jgi:hypothetical protein
MRPSGRTPGRSRLPSRPRGDASPLIRQPEPDRTEEAGIGMADVIYVAVTVGVFGVLALVARGVMRL